MGMHHKTNATVSTTKTNMTSDITNSRPTPIQQLFHLFEDSDNLINTSEMTFLLRCLGHNITDQSVHELLMSEQAGDKITYEEFCSLDERAHSYGILEKDIRRSFEYFDKESTGMVQFSILERILQESENTYNDVTDSEECVRLLGLDEKR